MRYFRNCPLCRGFSLEQQLFCPACWKRLEAKTPKLPHSKMQLGGTSYPLQHRYIYNWLGDNFLLAEIHQFLKTTPQSLESLLIPFFHCLPQKPKMFVPVPDSVLSLNLANSFSKLLGGEICDVLAWSYKKAPHKLLNKADRLKSRMKLKTPCDFLDNKTTLILVDDVVTTGATALAAFHALSKPRAFEVWSLSCRDLN